MISAQHRVDRANRHVPSHVKLKALIAGPYQQKMKTVILMIGHSIPERASLVFAHQMCTGLRDHGVR